MMTDHSDGQPMYILQEGGEEDTSTLESQQGTVNIFTQDGQMVMEITGQGDQSQFADYGIDEVQAGEQMLQIANTFINAQEGEPHLLHIANTFTDQGKNSQEKKIDENYDTHIKGEIIQSENGSDEMHIVYGENEHMYSVQENSSLSAGEQSVLVQIPEIQNIADQSFMNSGVQTVDNISQEDNQEIIIEGMPIQYQNLQNVRSEVLPDGTVQLYVVDEEAAKEEEDQTTESDEKFIVTEEEQPSVVSVVKETRYRDVATQITCYPKFSRQGLFDVATQVTKRDILGGTVKNRQLPNGTTIIQNNIKTQNQSTVILNAGASSQMVFYKCNICGKLYKNKLNWQNHIKTHATEKVYMCGHCGKIFQKASLASHLRTHSELAQIAVFENLPDNMKRKNHKAIPGLILSSEEASIIELDIIDVPTEADESMLPEPEPEPEPPQADLSEVYTDNDIPAKMHMEVEAETEIQEGTKSKFVYKCNVCGKEYNSKSNCHRHLKSHTNDKEYKCGYCGKGFTHKYEVRMHCRIHTGEKPFKCPICTRGFNESGNLRRHMKIHVKDESPYKCGVCFKGFNNTARLNAHMKVHTGEIVCDTCNRKFNKISDLYRHIRIHTGERPYKCDFCDKTFCQKVNLVTHKRTHTGLKAFRCDLCGLGFSRKTILDTHMQTHDNPAIAKDRGTVERTPVKMEPSEELQIIENEMSRDQSQINRVDTTPREIITTDSGTEMEIEQLAIQQDISLDEEIHVQEETCVTIG